jgi:hypothetical protein
MPELSPELVKALFGGGGLLGAIALLARWWRGRATVTASFVEETYDLDVQPSVLSTVTLELETVGREPTSVVREVRLSYLTSRTKRRTAVLQIQSNDRTLQPVTPKTFVLRGSVSADYLFSHFRVFKVQFARGRSVHVRVLNASGQTAGAARFSWLRTLFVIFGALPHVEA